MVSALASRHIFVESISVLLSSLQRYFGFCRWQILDNFICVKCIYFLYLRFILVIFSSVKEAGTQFRCSDFSFLVFVFWHLFWLLSFVQKLLHKELCAFVGCYYSNCCSYWTSHLWPHSGNALHQVPISTIFFPSWFNFVLPRNDSGIFDNLHLQLKVLYLGKYLFEHFLWVIAWCDSILRHFAQSSSCYSLLSGPPLISALLKGQILYKYR